RELQNVALGLTLKDKGVQSLIEQINRLYSQALREKFFEQGTEIFREGDAGSEAFRILEGRIEIFMRVGGQNKVTLGHLVPGDIFGEMALLDDKPRSASARALEPTRLQIMNVEEFNDLFLSDPSALAPFLSSFFERLRNTNELLRRELEGRKVPTAEVHQLLQHGIAIPHAEPSPLPKIILSPANKETRTAGAPETVSIDRLPFRIGRRQAGEGADILSANDLALRDQYPYQISRNHCAIERIGAELVVRDRGSTLGTILNGHAIGTEAEHMVLPLKPGINKIVLGGDDSSFQFNVQVDAA
ncbi:MAG: FHA domain-containing protein, partial [Verrucomicrobia bacterium]|nr:FHA domain-containing protein [Verrucomicrobiota bacterium]